MEQRKGRVVLTGNLAEYFILSLGLMILSILTRALVPAAGGEHPVSVAWEWRGVSGFRLAPA